MGNSPSSEAAAGSGANVVKVNRRASLLKTRSARLDGSTGSATAGGTNQPLVGGGFERGTAHDDRAISVRTSQDIPELDGIGALSLADAKAALTDSSKSVPLQPRGGGTNGPAGAAAEDILSASATGPSDPLAKSDGSIGMSGGKEKQKNARGAFCYRDAVKLLELDPGDARVPHWLELAQDNQQVQVCVGMDGVDTSMDRLNKLALIAETKAPAVHNLFKILATSAERDANFMGLEFGINRRTEDITAVIQDTGGLGGLPVVVPISAMVDQFPKYFNLNPEDNLVSFSAAYDQLSGPLQDYIESTFNFRFSEEQLETIHSMVSESWNMYMNAWNKAARDDFDASIVLLGMKDVQLEDLKKEKKTGVQAKYKFQPGPQPLEGMLADGAECMEVMKKALGTDWVEEDQDGHIVHILTDVQAPFPKCQITCPGVKSEKRARQKADFKYSWAGEDRYRRLRDYARMGFMLDTIPDILQVITVFVCARFDYLLLSQPLYCSCNRSHTLNFNKSFQCVPQPYRIPILNPSALARSKRSLAMITYCRSKTVLEHLPAWAIATSRCLSWSICQVARDSRTGNT
mmetsp:Transcript_64420/g.178510  ORF Transcript_64420/g.178510 Transcript_64420/m.178510 type:complete len:576 (-) Transcript_64420:1030-2757(-)